MNGIEMVIKKANEASTQTEFLKSIQYNDRFGCITVGESKWYPELQGRTTVSMFLKGMYKSVKAMIVEDNEAIQEIIEETPVVVEEVAVSNELVETVVVTEEVNVVVKEASDTNNTKQTNHINKALTLAGYECEPTESNLIECFKDYVDAGIWSNLDLDEVDDMIADNELTVIHMCNALIRYCRRGA